jgi:hypothetical protein
MAKAERGPSLFRSRRMKDLGNYTDRFSVF